MGDWSLIVWCLSIGDIRHRSKSNQIIRPVKEQIFVTIFVLDCFSITTLVGAHKLQKWRSAVNVKSDTACNARLITFCQPVFGINLRWWLSFFMKSSFHCHWSFSLLVFTNFDDNKWGHEVIWTHAMASSSARNAMSKTKQTAFGDCCSIKHVWNFVAVRRSSFPKISWLICISRDVWCVGGYFCFSFVFGVWGKSCIGLRQILSDIHSFVDESQW